MATVVTTTESLFKKGYDVMLSAFVFQKAAELVRNDSRCVHEFPFPIDLESHKRLIWISD